MNPSELTKAQIQELNEKLENKKNSLSSEIRELEQELTQQGESSDQGAPDEVDRSSYEEQIQRSQIVLAGKKNLLFEINEAIKRIESNSYGVCEETEEPIGYKRLAAQPWTRLSLEAQQDLEQRRKGRVNSGASFPSSYDD